VTFGVALVEDVIANILCWFDRRLPSDIIKEEDLDMSEVNGLNVTKKIPLHLVPILLSLNLHLCIHRSVVNVLIM
jgi:hypothetical protein